MPCDLLWRPVRIQHRNYAVLLGSVSEQWTGVSWSHHHHTEPCRLILSCNLSACRSLALLSLRLWLTKRFFFFFLFADYDWGDWPNLKMIQSHLVHPALKTVTKCVVCMHELQLLVASWHHCNPPPLQKKSDLLILMFGNSFSQAQKMVVVHADHQRLVMSCPTHFSVVADKRNGLMSNAVIVTLSNNQVRN